MPDRTPEAPPAELSGPLKPRPRVLVVEDDADARNGLGQRLRWEGSDPVFAADVPAAIAAARIKRPDLIFLDLGLPGGDGYLVMQRLQAIPDLAGIPIVVLSARDPLVERRRAMEAGAVAYYQKPIRNNDLRAAIRDAIAA